ncbi:CobW family GTP-binding protein [Paraglaciecola sp.]|uniref:CobW family GTP-binding protein n=1 Tax=Paraglaciecola sp. TaxID=1920173 RepID=UPI003EF6BA30
MTAIQNVPTNVITGALGAGKTTLIQALLANKPKTERWAVLVNEFGEVGIDGSYMNGGANNQSTEGIFIKEVPGGCMCCASNLPMQIALNLLLAQAKPDRLLIEPTGLGHPQEVLQALTEPHYQEVLDVQATLALIDLRKLEEPKWRDHQVFKEQLRVADIVVVTKSDLYTESYQIQFEQYLEEIGQSDIPIQTAIQGNIDLGSLEQTSNFKTSHTPNTHKHHAHEMEKLTAPENGVLRVNNQGEGFYSRGWLCALSTELNFDNCMHLFLSISVERLKAVLLTDKGPMMFNVVDGNLQATPLTEVYDSRIEIITSNEQEANFFANQIDSLFE